MGRRRGPGGPAAADPVRTVVERTFRQESGRAIATLTRFLGDLSAAEDAVQEAFVQALRTWPGRGVPDQPRAWIITTARNRALDRLRREARRPSKEAAAGLPAGVPPMTEAEPTDGTGTAPGTGPGEEDDDTVDDDRLRLMFTCCHPALAPAAQVALTLRMVCGLQTAEIARAFLQPEATVYQRLSRAKAKIRTAGIPFRVPPGYLLVERVPPVLACVYLVFSEGYAASGGDDLIRRELCDEGIRLARLVVELMPDEPEARGLHALVLLQDSRRAARVGPDGGLVLLEDQDRTLWDHDRIDVGLAQLELSLRRGPAGPYRLQAAIAAVHATAPTWADTDWHRMVALYDELARQTGSPVVALNRAVAVSYAAGPDAALALVDALADDPRLAHSHRLPAARADFLRRLGRHDEAADAYRGALARVGSGAERAFLARRLRDLAGA